MMRIIEHSMVETIRRKDMSDTWKLSPKGCAIVAMLDAKIIDDINDERLNDFWRSFQLSMLKCDYIKLKEDNNE